MVCSISPTPSNNKVWIYKLMNFTGKQMFSGPLVVFFHMKSILLQIADICCFICSLWRDLNINCCDEGSCNFYDSSSETCKTLVCIWTDLQELSGVTKGRLNISLCLGERGLWYCVWEWTQWVCPLPGLRGPQSIPQRIWKGHESSVQAIQEKPAQLQGALHLVLFTCSCIIVLT